MKGLFVGARVRIVKCYSWPELEGTEGRIVGVPDAHEIAVPGIKPDWIVAPDAWGSERAPYAGMKGATRFTPASNQLEPILPEGAQPSEFQSLRDLMDSLTTPATALT